MINKIKLIDLLSLLSLVLFIGAIIFLIIAFIANEKFNNINLSLNKEIKTILIATFSVSMILFLLAIITTVFVSIFVLLNKWNNQYLDQKKILYFWLNIILITLCIPMIVYAKKLVNIIINNNNVCNKNINTKKQNMQNKNIIVNEPYLENNKWKYYDGTNYWLMNENNEWIIEEK